MVVCTGAAPAGWVAGCTGWVAGGGLYWCCSMWVRMVGCSGAALVERVLDCTVQYSRNPFGADDTHEVVQDNPPQAKNIVIDRKLMQYCKNLFLKIFLNCLTDLLHFFSLL